MARATSSLPTPLSPVMRDGHRCGRDLGNAFDHRLHSGVAGNECLVAGLFGAGRPDLLLQERLAREADHRVFDLRILEGLRDEVRGAAVHGRYRHLDRAVARDQDDPHMRPCALDFVEEGQSRKAGMVMSDTTTCGSQVRSVSRGLLCAICRPRLGADGLPQHAQAETNIGFIIHDQDPAALGRRRRQRLIFGTGRLGQGRRSNLGIAYERIADCAALDRPGTS